MWIKSFYVLYQLLHCATSIIDDRLSMNVLHEMSIEMSMSPEEHEIYVSKLKVVTLPDLIEANDKRIQEERRLQALQSVYKKGHSLHPFYGFPQFRVLTDGDDERITLENSRGKTVDIIFIPLNYPSCSKEIVDFSEHLEEFYQIGCDVLACSNNAYKRNQTFAAYLSKMLPLDTQQIPLAFRFEDEISYNSIFIADGYGNIRTLKIRTRDEAPPQLDRPVAVLATVDLTSSDEIPMPTSGYRLDSNDTQLKSLPYFEKAGKICFVRKM